jgi:hypothetical protein
MRSVPAQAVGIDQGKNLDNGEVKFQLVLYTCGQQKRGANLGHPCARAARALDRAGIDYDIKTVSGYRLMPWTRSGDQRDEIERLSGQGNVPILVLDDNSVISGSSEIVSWARARQGSASS